MQRAMRQRAAESWELKVYLGRGAVGRNEAVGVPDVPRRQAEAQRALAAFVAERERGSVVTGTTAAPNCGQPWSWPSYAFGCKRVGVACVAGAPFARAVCVRLACPQASLVVGATRRVKNARRRRVAPCGTMGYMGKVTASVVLVIGYPLALGVLLRLRSVLAERRVWWFAALEAATVSIATGWLLRGRLLPAAVNGAAFVGFAIAWLVTGQRPRSRRWRGRSRLVRHV